ncbi:hypothetical protein MCOR27_011467 [Pyricularia oryzae]|uniref:Cyclase n=2 Tax=Pyricularia TaxID=48558 RepID=A0ABQ8N2G2_PYRGI|nr:hypothetical protein MCOR01_005164 [Pyricularia oryzae]KAI6290114.1 hypothetical protein MCOR33_011514 [Pyricularia grisea]KAI6252146.1 hypothetical protein MCOR19_011237 [Pyricularia oryzae]KAI6264545.1 hypothetical protein MCOR26_011275 [Pyricularia oryzae]KAI6265247.1 hypothetical protein MCOR27_011467 [Pyricularia oryzae]
MASHKSTSRPAFNDLPFDKKGPIGNAWGLWGPEDQLGTLNLLTDEIVARAARENILTGQRISLNWSMTGAKYPEFPRKSLEQKLINKAPLKHAHDDMWTFNSQCSSQWDGFRHYAYQKEQLYFMGRTAEEFAASPIPNGIQHVSRQGICGRGVLIDWYRWARAQSRVIDATTAHPIPFSELMEALRHQGMSPDDILQGDILIIRSGYIEQYESLAEEKAAELNEMYKTQKPSNIGVEPSRELLEFLWEKRIAAVCGDSRSFEVWPCTQLEWHLHEWLLAGWGMPIGELFELNGLSEACAEKKRWTTFLSTSPMNVEGGVASPPNAIAYL